MANKLKDLTGNKFNMLKVLSRADNGSRGQTRWLCMCDCGNETIVDASDLTKKDSSKAVKSCGCLVSKDLTGNKYGMLTVLQKTTNRNSNGEILYKCICECGTLKEIHGSQLKNNKTVSCGCKSKTHIELMKKKLEFIDGTCVQIIKSNKVRTDSTTGIKGVHYYKATGKYTAHIRFKGKGYHLGYYEDINDAKRIRKIAEEKLFGEFIEWYNEGRIKDENF